MNRCDDLTLLLCVYNVYVYVHVHIHVYVGMYVFMYECAYACMYVCMHVCMEVGVHMSDLFCDCLICVYTEPLYIQYTKYK